MFPKRQRISKGTFQNIATQGRRTHNESLTMVKTPLQTGVLSRFAVVVSKKVAATAVDRNILRRRIYKALEEVCKNKKSTAYIVFAKKPARHMSFNELKKEIEVLCNT